MRSILIIVLFMAVSSAALAAYNANMQGKLAMVMVYTDGDYIYMKLENQPASHPSCNASYFVTPSTVPLERRKMLLARLMLAYSTGEE